MWRSGILTNTISYTSSNANTDKTAKCVQHTPEGDLSARLGRRLCKPRSHMFGVMLLGVIYFGALFIQSFHRQFTSLANAKMCGFVTWHKQHMTLNAPFLWTRTNTATHASVPLCSDCFRRRHICRVFVCTVAHTSSTPECVCICHARGGCLSRKPRHVTWHVCALWATVMWVDWQTMTAWGWRTLQLALN